MPARRWSQARAPRVSVAGRAGPSLPNTRDKLRASNMLNARLLHPLVRQPVAPRHYGLSSIAATATKCAPELPKSVSKDRGRASAKRAASCSCADSSTLVLACRPMPEARARAPVGYGENMDNSEVRASAGWRGACCRAVPRLQATCHATVALGQQDASVECQLADGHTQRRRTSP